MSKFSDKFIDGMSLVAEKVDENRFLGAIKDSFTIYMPFVIVGSFMNLFNTILCSTTTGLAKWIPALEALKPIFTAANFATLSCMTLPIVFLIGLKLGKKNNVPEHISAIMALASYLTICPQIISVVVDDKTGTASGLPGAALGSQGLFVGMLVAILASQLFAFLMTFDKLKIKMPASVPTAITTSFNALIPIVLTLLGVSVGGYAFRQISGQYLTDWIYTTIQHPLENAFQSPAGLFIIILVCRAYLKRFIADYRVNATSLDIDDDYSDMDYEEIGSYFSMMIDRVNNYLTVRNDQDGSYLSASGQSYSAIKKQVQNLQGYTLREYQSYIWEKGVAKNNFRCIDDLNELNRTLRWDEMSDSQKSAIYMTILDNYNNKMVSSVLIPTYDNDGAFYMSRTKIGIDDLALQANELLSSAVEAQKSIATNNSKVTALEQLTESHEVQMAQAMVDNITRQLADIVSATRELDADCYAQRIRSYLMFSEPQMSFMQRYNVKRSVMLAALVCAVCYLGAAVQACVRRQRQRMENE